MLEVIEECLFCSKGGGGKVVLHDRDVVSDSFERHLEVLKCSRFLVVIVVR
jgi:hypothetical protein